MEGHIEKAPSMNQNVCPWAHTEYTGALILGFPAFTIVSNELLFINHFFMGQCNSRLDELRQWLKISVCSQSDNTLWGHSFGGHTASLARYSIWNLS